MTAHSEIDFNPAQELARKKRGIIIADSTSLIDLATNLPDEAFINPETLSNENRNLWSTQSFLGLNGFDIKIPAMVLYEVTFTLGQQEIFLHYLDKSLSEDRIRLASLINKNIRETSASLIFPDAKDDSKAADFIRVLQEAHESGHLSTCEKWEKKKLIRGSVRKNYGDMAALQLLLGLKDEGVPIFYLSDDTEATRNILRVRPDLDVHALTFYDYLAALSNQGILTKLGYAERLPSGYLSLIAEAHRARRLDQRYSSQKNEAAFADALEDILFEPVRLPAPTSVPAESGQRKSLKMIEKLVALFKTIARRPLTARSFPFDGPTRDYASPSAKPDSANGPAPAA